MQVCEFFVNCGLYLAPFIRKQKSHHKTEKIKLQTGVKLKRKDFGWAEAGV